MTHNPEVRQRHYTTNREKLLAYQTEYRKANREKLRIAQAIYYAEHREEISARTLKSADEEKYKRRLARQNRSRARRLERIAGRPKPDVCEIPGCGGTAQICFDHDHAIENFRGWICRDCNAASGSVKDRPEILIALAAYLTANGH